MKVKTCFGDLFTRHIQGLKPSANGEALGLCPFHEDNRPSLSVNLESGLWHCFGCGKKGNSGQFAELVGESSERGRGPLGERIIDTYDYQDLDGKLLYQVVRLAPKDFRQRRPDGAGKWIWNLEGVKRVPYRLPQLNGREIVYVVEGEKDADLLWSLGIPATTNSGGAGKWRDECSVILLELGITRAVLLPDNDVPGGRHMVEVRESLGRKGITSKIVALPGLPPGGDVSDFLKTHGKEGLEEAAKAALEDLEVGEPREEKPGPARPPLPEELRARVVHPALDLGGDWASVGILDERGVWRIVTGTRRIYEAEAIVDALRFRPKAYPDLAGRWPEQELQAFLDGEEAPGFGEILAVIIDRARAVLELPKAEHYSLLAVWVVGTYFHPIFIAYPRLAFMGERESGKSKAQTLLSALSFNGLHRLAPTPAVLFRIVQAFRPTLCLDEMEGLAREDRHEIMAIINSGYKAGGAVDRVEGKAARWIESYQVYAPMALAGIRGLNPTTEDRTIPLVFQRSTHSEMLNAEVDPADPLLAKIRGALYRLLLTKSQTVREMYRSLFLPTWLTGRVRELWKPLLTISTLADQEESFGFTDQLLGLAKGHAQEREPLSEEATALIAILEENLGIEAEVEITPGDLCGKMEQALRVKDFSAQRVGGILRRLGFARAGRRAGLSRYRITAEKLRDAFNRYRLTEIA